MAQTNLTKTGFWQAVGVSSSSIVNLPSGVQDDNENWVHGFLETPNTEAHIYKLGYIEANQFYEI